MPAKTLDNHILYYKPTCPYCRIVFDAMQMLDISMETRNTFEADHEAELIEVGGKRQVPCLVIEGSPMYESADIVTYLKTC